MGGEWHTFGSNLDPNLGYVTDMYNNSYTISEQAKRTIIDTYQREFTRSRLVGRYPPDTILVDEGNVGFHDDFFMPFRNESSSFDEAVEENMLWKNGPIGGEAPPEFAHGDQGDTNREAVFTTERGVEMIESGHYTTMLLDKPSESDELLGYMNLHRKMGYNYQIDKALFVPQVSNTKLDVLLFINNIGVAPIYYSCDVEFALLKSNDTPVRISEALYYDLQNIMPSDITQIDGRIDISNLDSGECSLGVRIIQPGAQNSKDNEWGLLARNTYIEFSNNIETIEGFWNSNNVLEGSCSILGNVKID